MAVNARVLSASALVVAGALAAVVVGQVPAVGAADRGVTVTPASPPQSLVCPGPAVAVGAAGTSATSVSATGQPVRTAGTPSRAAVQSTPLKRGGVSGTGAAPRLLQAAAASTAGPLAGAQVEQVAGGDAVGLAAAACTAPTAEAWLAAGATTTGRTSVLLLANPTSAPARVTVRLWSENGPVRQSGSGDIAVPAGDRRAVSLAGLAPAAGGLVVQVTSAGARIGAAIEQRTVRGLESGGVDVAGATAPPASTVTIPGVRIAGAAAVATTQRQDDYGDLQPVVRVLLPGDQPADVSITVRPAAGGNPIEVGRRVAAGVVTDFPLPGLPDGTYSVRVRSSVPVVAAARVSVVTAPAASATPSGGASSSSGTASGAPAGSDAGLVTGGAVNAGSSGAPATGSSTSAARGIDLAWLAAASPLGDTAVVAVGAAPSPVLTVAGNGRARSVRVSGAASATLQVPAEGAVSLPVNPGLVVLQGAAGLTAGISYAGPDAIAGYAVPPADQQAKAVRITN